MAMLSLLYSGGHCKRWKPNASIDTALKPMTSTALRQLPWLQSHSVIVGVKQRRNLHCYPVQVTCPPWSRPSTECPNQCDGAMSLVLLLVVLARDASWLLLAVQLALDR